MAGWRGDFCHAVSAGTICHGSPPVALSPPAFAHLQFCAPLPGPQFFSGAVRLSTALFCFKRGWPGDERLFFCVGGAPSLLAPPPGALLPVRPPGSRQLGGWHSPAALLPLLCCGVLNSCASRPYSSPAYSIGYVGCNGLPATLSLDLSSWHRPCAHIWDPSLSVSLVLLCRSALEHVFLSPLRAPLCVPAGCSPLPSNNLDSNEHIASHSTPCQEPCQRAVGLRFTCSSRLCSSAS